MAWGNAAVCVNELIDSSVRRALANVPTIGQAMMAEMLRPPTSQVAGREVGKHDRRAVKRRLDDKRRAALPPRKVRL